jgi:ribonuclease HI
MKIYTDGSAHPTNPGPGGLGIVVCDDDNNIITTISKHFDTTITNNQMELLALLLVLKLYGKQKEMPTVYTDSSYALNTYTNWMFGWANRGWIKSDNKIPENLNIIKEYYELINQGYRINIQKVKAHAGHEINELADKLAKGEIKSHITI